MSNSGQQILEIMKRAGWYNRWLFSWVEPYLEKNVLEVGCGIGNFTHLLLGKGRKVTAIDIEKEYIDGIRRRIESSSLRTVVTDIETGDLSRLGTFDSAVCMNVLEHIEDDKRALQNIFNLLTKGGKLILLVPAHPALYGRIDEVLGHKRRYRKNELENKLRQAGFKIKTMRYLNLLGGIGWFVNSRIFKKELIPGGQLSLFDKVARPFLFLEKVIEMPFGLSLLAIATKND